jgi:hypothetical protein
METKALSLAIRMLGLTLLLTACGNGSLTRGKASALLEKEKPILDVGTRMRQTLLLRLDIWVPDHDIKGKPSQLRVLKFLEQLKGQGFLQGPQTQRYNLLEGPGTHYYFHVVPSEDVQESGGNEIDLQVALTHPYYGEVSGITQEGNQAEAEVVVKHRATKAYAAIAQALEAAPGKELQGDKWSMGYVLPNGWGAEDLVASSDKTTVSFQKYDDGWRLR